MAANKESYIPSKYEVADIFRKAGPAYRANNGLRKRQYAVMHAIEKCRTSYFGYHSDRCNTCKHIEREYNSCRDRHCPKCQGISRKKWIDKRLDDLLPVPYYHGVFTLPKMLGSIISYNRRLIYEILFSKASETLLQFGHDPDRLGGEIGFFGVLHTWGQKLWQHPHVHFIIPGGAIAKDGQWIEPKYKGKFLFPVRALSEVFRGKFVEALKRSYYDGKLILPEDEPELQCSDYFENWVDRLVSRNWVVYCKRPFGGADRVVKYVGRYTHQVAISNNRITEFENGRVSFRYKDYKSSQITWKSMSLDFSEFIRRFLLHVLPNRFHKIRHYGYLANGRCKAAVSQIRELLDDQRQELQQNDPTSGKTCPKCEKGILIPFLVKDLFGNIRLLVENDCCQNRVVFDTS